MRVRLYRPVYQRRARCLLAVALLLPGAGFLSAAGLNPVSVTATATLLLAALVIVWDALRAVAVVIRSGVLIPGTLGHRAHAVGWDEIVRVDADGQVVSIATRGELLYQLQLDARAARLLSRMIERRLLHRAGSQE